MAPGSSGKFALQDLTESGPEPEKPGRLNHNLLRPKAAGYCTIILAILAFTAGRIGNELALTLLGTVLLAVLAYCFLGVFMLGVINRHKAGSLSMIMVSETVNAGGEAEFLIRTAAGDAPPKHYFLRLPGILVRYELCLATGDGRVIRHYADPVLENSGSFPVRERGAYYSFQKTGEHDNFLIFDAPGFFYLTLPVYQGESPRLFAIPGPAGEPVSVSLKSGGSKERNEPHYRKSDELTDHRPYVPGDDPRRINWKLSSHSFPGVLFVRDGESKPPPHSKLLILIDTEADCSLFTAEEARRAVDLLCENALAVALDLSALGMDICIGYSGGRIIEKKEGIALDAAELAAALAWPAAIPFDADGKLPKAELPKVELPKADLPKVELPKAALPPAPEDRSVLIFALPRVGYEISALDRFLENRTAVYRDDSGVHGFSFGTNIIFIYDAKVEPAPEEAAVFCAGFYGGKPGVQAYKAGVVKAEERLNR